MTLYQNFTYFYLEISIFQNTAEGIYIHPLLMGLLITDLISLWNSFCCLSMLKSNTRHNNILDLFLTNDSNFVQYIKCLDIFISDHLLIQIYTNFFKNLNTESQIIQIDSNELNFLNFDLNKANFKEINYYMNKID